MISLHDIALLRPEIILAAGAVIVMFGIAVKRNAAFSNILTLIIFVLAFIFVLQPTAGREYISGLFVVDGLGSYLSVIIIAAAFIITLFSYPYFKIQTETKEEFYILLILATLGSVCMVISNHFISFVLSLELLSVSLFSLIGYLKNKKVSIEAAIKYLIMAAVATSFVLFGFALIYAETGNMDLQGISENLQDQPPGMLVVAGLALSIVGFGFKMALVPFHFWTPDIYAGAPAPVSAFVATISKGAAFIFLLRLFYSVGGLSQNGIWIAFAVLATASMFIGNWLALRQQNIKRLLAYSSVSHLGYLMVAFLSFSEPGIRAASFYLLVYFVSMLAAFGLITYFSGKKGEPMMVEDYRGLFWSKPWLAAFFTLVMFSLAGIPFSAGFMGKFYILASGMNSGPVFLLIVLVVSSTIGLFYYLRVVGVMLSRTGSVLTGYIGERSLILKILLIILFLLMIWFGTWPAPVLDWMAAF